MIFFTVESALTLAAILVSLAAPGLVNRPAERIERTLRPLWARPIRLVLSVMLLATTLRAAMLPLVGPSVMRIHDEHSMLLQAKTLLTGAFAAPPHPFWQHFESFHINVIPTHASIYFPGRSFPMAVGLWLADEPWVGIWLSMILMSGAIAWMLLGWVRPSMALVGGLIVVVRFGVFSYWINSFWGGAFTALGAALVLGALPRLLRAFDWRNGWLMGIGLLILMTTRPYEGLWFCLPVAAILSWRAWRQLVGGDSAGVLRMAVPAVVCFGLGLAVLLSVNKATTGNYAVTPYEVNRERYATAPAMLFAPSIVPMAVPDDRFARFYAWEDAYHQRRSLIAGLPRVVVDKLYSLWKFYVGVALLLPFLLGAIYLIRTRPLLLLPAVSVVGGFMLVTWDFAHYAAPVLTGVIAATVVGLDQLRTWRFRGCASGAALSRLLPMVGVVLLAIPAAHLATGFPPLWNNNWSASCCAFETETVQSRTAAQLKASPGRDLVIVRYAPTDSIHTEWIYNEPDPDAADIVWAKDLGPARNNALRAYYRNRHHWLIDGVSGVEGGRPERLSTAELR